MWSKKSVIRNRVKASSKRHCFANTAFSVALGRCPAEPSGSDRAASPLSPPCLAVAVPRPGSLILTVEGVQPGRVNDNHLISAVLSRD